MVQNNNGALDDGTAGEARDVPSMNVLLADTLLGARPVARDTLAVHRTELWRAGAHARTVVLQQVLRALLNNLIFI